MSRWIIIYGFLIFILFAGLSLSQASPEINEAPKTEHRFRGLQVNGKYQVPMQLNSSVEGEKYLDDLLGLRKDFTDRIRDQKERR